MTSLDLARQGRHAARHLRIRLETHTLTTQDMVRLLDKIDAGFDQMLGPSEPAGPLPAGLKRGSDLTVIDGGRP